MRQLTLSTVKDVFAICRLDRNDSIPEWALKGEFFALTKTKDELSIVCREVDVPKGVQCEKGWKGLKVEGPLDFGLIGILSSLTRPLANHNISVFAVSTYDTDYLFVKRENYLNCVKVLRGEGFTFLEEVE